MVAISNNLCIGTSGFSYPDWKYHFYPPHLKKEEYLNFYSSIFSCLEINYTYYRMPSQKHLAGMLKKVPESFIFSVKGTANLTHNPKCITESTWNREADQFSAALSPLIKGDRLGAVLLQFPYSFHYTTKNREYLSNLCSHLKALPICLEFRNNEWFNNKVYKEMEKRNLTLVIPDLPDIANLPHPELVVTNDMGYIRFHGKRAETWWTGNAAERYDYLYNAEELKLWIPQIKKLEKQVNRLFIIFNNHYKGKATKNALQLQKML